MSTLQLLPDLSERLASELVHMISNVAEPCRSQLISMLKLQSQSDQVDLMSSLTGWLAGMKPEVMVLAYSRFRQLILVVSEINRDEGRQ